MTAGRKTVLALALVLPAAAAFSQQSTTALTTARPRSSYDPAAKAGAPADTTSAMGKALHAVNPQDKDYGAALDTVRLTAIQETVDNFLWWTDLVLAVGFTLSMAGNYWQHRRSEDRLRISSAIVAQLYNSHIASRSKALEAIAKHNQLADLYNAQSDELTNISQQKETSETKKGRQDETKLAQNLRPPADKAQSTEQTPARSTRERPEKGGRKAGSTEVTTEGGSQDDEDLVTQLRAQLATKDEQLAAKDVQIGAKDQKIQNLRTLITRPHTSLTEEREGRPVRSA